MLEPKHLADDDPRVTSVLAICTLARDYYDGYGQAALRGLMPSAPDLYLDMLATEVGQHLEVADRLYEEGSGLNAELDRDQWIGHAKAAARDSLHQWADVQAVSA